MQSLCSASSRPSCSSAQMQAWCLSYCIIVLAQCCLVLFISLCKFACLHSLFVLCIHHRTSPYAGVQEALQQNAKQQAGPLQAPVQPLNEPHNCQHQIQHTESEHQQTSQSSCGSTTQERETHIRGANREQCLKSSSIQRCRASLIRPSSAPSGNRRTLTTLRQASASCLQRSADPDIEMQDTPASYWAIHGRSKDDEKRCAMQRNCHACILQLQAVYYHIVE